jgi:hypothetical protein
MYHFKKRLDALEQAEQAQPERLGRLTADLLLIYATPADQAAWQTAGRPALDRATIEKALDQAYNDPV